MAKKTETPKPNDTEPQPVGDDVVLNGDNETPEPITQPNVDIDAMLDEITASMQPPSPDLDIAPELVSVQGDIPDDVYTDATGAVWDKTQHATGSDGKPIYTARGLFRKRRSYSGAVPLSPTANACRKAGRLAAIAFAQTGVAVFGEEWQPIVNDNENEREMLECAFADYFEAKGITDIPAGLALTIALGGYSIRRLGKPQTKSRLAKAKDYIKGKLSRFHIRKPKPKKPAQPTAFSEVGAG